MLNVGQHIDRYVVEGKLGEGGMAEVYRVRHETLRTAHALKVLTLTDSGVRDRLVREGRMQAHLVHENVVQVTDVLSIGGQPGLLMEFVEGPTLEQWLNRYRPTVQETEIVFRALCTGVGFAHHRGLIHRDLKPSNVLLSVVDDRIVPKVADFGLARQLDALSSRHTRSGATMGTPGYMPPEQIRDASTVDRRADLWSLGCILYRMVCGVPAFDGDDLLELFTQVGNADYVPSRRLRPELPERLHGIIDRTIRVALTARVGDCALLIDFLDGRGESIDLTYTAKARLPASERPRALTGSQEALSVAHTIVEEMTLGLPKLDREIAWPNKVPQASLHAPPMHPRGEILGPGSEPSFHASSDLPPPGAHRGSLAAESKTIPPAPVRPPRAPAPNPTIVAPPSSGGFLSGLWMVLSLGLAIGGAVLLLVLGGAGLWFVSQSSLLAQVSPSKAAPVPISVVPAPAPTRPVPAEPSPARPVPDVSAPRPELVPPKPVPPKPQPAEPLPPAEETTGTVKFTGVDELWLEGPSGAVRDLAHIPPGRYKVMAIFPDAGAVAAHPSVLVKAGRETLLTCVPAFAQCKAKE